MLLLFYRLNNVSLLTSIQFKNIVQKSIIIMDPIVQFGKYKGKPLSIMLSDSQYIQWCKDKNILEKYPDINKLIKDAYPKVTFEAKFIGIF